MSTKKPILIAALLAGALLLPARGSADPRPLTPPDIPGVAPLPGPIAPASKPAFGLRTSERPVRDAKAFVIAYRAAVDAS